MAVERQQGKPYQRFLFRELEEGLRHGDPGEGGTGPGATEEQAVTASDPARALTERLMGEVCKPDNLNQACRRVKANKGRPGVDGMTVDELRAWFAAHEQEFLLRYSTDHTNRNRCAGCRSRSPVAGCGNWASRRSLTGLCSRRFCKCWNPYWTRPSRTPAMAFVGGVGRMTPWLRHRST
jgi:hypothetical protein